MKKLLVILSLSLLLVCFFALGVSADTTTSIHAGVDKTQSVTLNDGTVCNLFDADGNALIWFVTGTDENGANTYASIRADIGTSGENKVDYIIDYWADTIQGVYANQIDRVLITYNGKSYDAKTIVVFNIMDDDVFVTTDNKYSGKHVGAPVNCMQKTFQGANKLEYAYLRLDTVAFQTGAFENCTSMKYVNFTDLTELRQIESNAFWCCVSLFADQTLDLSKTKLVRIGQGGIAGNKNNSDKMKYNKLILPETITSFGNYSFQYNDRLITVEGLENTKISSVPDNLFLKCTALTEIKIPSTVTSLGTSAFNGCSSLESVTMPNGITYMGNDLFKECSELETVTWPTSMTCVPTYCFYKCSSLKNITLSDKVTVIYNSAFYGCSSLEAFYLPRTIVTLDQGDGSGVFSGCTKIYFVNNPGETTKPDVYYFPERLISTLKVETFKSCNALSSTLVFPVGVTGVNNGWALGCTGIGSNTRNVVFLGNVSTFYFSNETKNTNYYLVNEKVDYTTLKVLDGNKQNSNNCYLYVCAGERYAALVYDAEDKVTWQEDYTHLKEKDEVVKADCVTPEYTQEKCFCKKSIGEKKTGDALGHDFNENPSLIVYENGNFFVNGTATHSCLRENCNECEEKIASPLFIAKGFAKTEADVLGVSFIQYFGVNTDALQAYISQGEYTVVSYGLIAVVTLADPENKDIIDENGAYSNTVNGTQMGDYVVFGDTNYKEMEIKVTNIGEKNRTTLVYTNLCVVLKDKATEKIDAYYASMGEDGISVSQELTSANFYDNIKN